MDDDTYSISSSLEENTRDKQYIQLYETTNGENDLVEGKNIVYLSDNR